MTAPKGGTTVDAGMTMFILFIETGLSLLCKLMTSRNLSNNSLW